MSETDWLAFERFDFAPLAGRWGVVRMMGALSEQPQIPAAPRLVVTRPRGRQLTRRIRQCDGPSREPVAVARLVRGPPRGRGAPTGAVRAHRPRPSGDRPAGTRDADPAAERPGGAASGPTLAAAGPRSAGDRDGDRARPVGHEPARHRTRRREGDPDPARRARRHRPGGLADRPGSPRRRRARRASGQARRQAGRHSRRRAPGSGGAEERSRQAEDEVAATGDRQAHGLGQALPAPSTARTPSTRARGSIRPPQRRRRPRAPTRLLAAGSRRRSRRRPFRRCPVGQARRRSPTRTPRATPATRSPSIILGPPARG